MSKGLHDVSGLKTAGIHAGLKADANHYDLGLIHFKQPAKVAGVFTQNAIKAWPVQYDQALLAEQDEFQAILVNSGNANCCNGQQGQAAMLEIRQALAQSLDLPEESILLSSTGVIGASLEADQIIQALPALTSSLQSENSQAFSQAIMTTDTVTKQASSTLDVDGQTYTISATSKGSGMIHPRMGTMLAYIVTDANLSQEVLKRLLQEAVDDSFNKLTVDGDTSTNDSVFFCSNQEKDFEATDKNLALFSQALTELCQDLAKQMAADGEGASKCMTVQVVGAANLEDAESIAESVARSNLVKTAIFGADPNFGRVLAAVGYAGAKSLAPLSIDIFFESAVGCVQVCKDGQALPFDEEEAKKILQDPNIDVIIDLHQGEGSCQYWSSDLTYDYVKINAEYTT